MDASDVALDAFVVFSSVSSLFGTAGQANYAAANNACERLMERRRRAGRVGTAIQLGPLQDVGVVARADPDVLKGLQAETCFVPQNTDDTLAALDAILTSGAAVVSCFAQADPAQGAARKSSC